MKAPQPETAARSLLYVVMLVMRTVAADMRRSRRPLEPAQMGSLMKIALGPCTMSNLARHLAVSPPTVSKSIDMLVRRGWVERWVDKSDRRQTMVRLTARGRRVLGEIRQRTERHVTETLAPLTPAQRAQLVAALNMLSGVLSDPGDAPCAPGAERS
jgi:DNA-binding MarR family transcriptional regulator